MALINELETNSIENGGVVSAYFIMSWADEYWKGSGVEGACDPALSPSTEVFPLFKQNLIFLSTCFDFV